MHLEIAVNMAMRTTYPVNKVNHLESSRTAGTGRDKVPCTGLGLGMRVVGPGYRALSKMRPRAMWPPSGKAWEATHKLSRSECSIDLFRFRSAFSGTRPKSKQMSLPTSSRRLHYYLARGSERWRFQVIEAGECAPKRYVA